MIQNQYIGYCMIILQMSSTFQLSLLMRGSDRFIINKGLSHQVIAF